MEPEFKIKLRKREKNFHFGISHRHSAEVYNAWTAWISLIALSCLMIALKRWLFTALASHFSTLLAAQRYVLVSQFRHVIVNPD